MTIYTYPKDKLFFDKLKWISTKIGIQEVNRLTHLSLHKKVAGLGAEHIKLSNQIEEEAQIVSLLESIVIFSDIEQEVIGKFILVFKKNGLWPICSVVTKGSAQMSLAVLIEHLTEDRLTENRIKAKMSL